MKKLLLLVLVPFLFLYSFGFYSLNDVLKSKNPPAVFNSFITDFEQLEDAYLLQIQDKTAKSIVYVDKNGLSGNLEKNSKASITNFKTGMEVSFKDTTLQDVIIAKSVTVLQTGVKETPKMGMSSQQPPHNHPETEKQDVKVTEKIDKVDGGYTVEEVFSQKSSIANSTITVKAKVIRFSKGILGYNWVRLQDGTGSIDDGTHELLCNTSTDTDFNVGDIITVTGTVRVNHDVKGMITYPLLLENIKQK